MSKKERIHVLEYKNLGIECINVMQFSPRVFNSEIKLRNYPSMIGVKTGKLIYTTENHETIELLTDDAMFLPKGSSYNYVMHSTDVIYQITFDTSDTLTEALPKKLYKLNSFESGRFLKSFPQLEKAYNENNLHSQLTTISKIYELLSHFIESTISKDHTRGIAPAIEYIEQYYRSDFKIKFLADLCNVSENTFRKNFKSALGVTPLQYKNQLIMREACNLLKSGEFNISETAYLLGFDTPYSFSKAFKKISGISPKEYKNSFYN